MPENKRDGLIIWLYNTKYLRVLRRYGYVHYVSKRMKYAVMYCDHQSTDSVIAQLTRLKFVRHINRSHLQEVRTTYEKGKSIQEEKDEVFN
ncbi:MAG: YlbG family protein [Sporolactobacillus sp.]